MHPLRHQIGRLRRQSRRLILAYSIAMVVSGLVAAVLICGFADCLLRFQDHGIRAMATLAVILVVAWTIWRYLWPLRSLRMRDVEIARRVERRFPAFADRLSSSIDFLDQSEDQAAAGSAELRRAVITQTTADVENLPWSTAIDSRPAVRACAAALALLTFGCLVGAFQPLGALTALKRMALPYSDIPWPRNHHLAFKDPVTRIARGQDFEVELIDLNGVPPDDARIIYRFQSASSTGEEQLKPFKVGGAVIARRENVVRPFEYRAVGGDDETMDWTMVEIVEPPAIESIAITLHPPPYSGRPAVPSERRIEALRGSRVTMAGKTTKPIATAAVQQQNGPTIPLQVTEHGFGLSLPLTASQPWIIDTSGKYWIELRDAENLVGGADDLWDVRSIVDEPPRITLERPIGTLYVMAQATVPLKVKVSDDLAIHRVALHYLTPDGPNAGEQTVVLYEGPDQAVGAADEKDSQLGRGESREIDFDWQLAPLGLSAGIQLTLNASASDYLPQTGVSQPVRLIVLSASEFEERLAAREAGILAEIARVMKMQQETRAATSALQTQAVRVGDFRKQDADWAHTTELSQRQVRRSLASTGGGVLSQTTALLEELLANHFDSPELMRRVKNIQDEIRRLDGDELARTEQALVAVVKNAQLAMDAPQSGKSEIIGNIQQSLAVAIAGQGEVVSVLERLLDELTEWTDYRALAHEFAEIQRQEREHQKQTQVMQPATLGRDLKDLSAQEQADLQVLSGSQSELARHFDKLQQRMEQMHERIRQSAPSAAGSLADAIQLAQESAIASDMRDCARSLDVNRLGQAIEQQKTIDAKLDELLDILGNRGEPRLARLVKKLRAAEQKLSALRGEQQSLRLQIRQIHERLQGADGKEQQQNRDALARLMGEQQRLEEQIERLGRELLRLRAEESAQRIASAGEKMRTGTQAGEQGSSGTAADLADETKKELDEAQRQLADRRRQAEQDLAMEQLATVEQALIGLTARQESALAETKRLHGLRDENGALTAQQVQSLANLAGNQAQLKAETDAVAEKVTAAEVFQLAVRSAATQMERAAELLAQGQTNKDPQRAQQQAIVRLNQLLAALKEGKSVAAGEQNQKNGDRPDDAQPPANRPPPIVHSVTEIKLLTVMQEDVNRRTVELQGQIGEQAPNEAEAAELKSLAQEQGRIAELVAKMTARAAQEQSSE